MATGFSGGGNDDLVTRLIYQTQGRQEVEELRRALDQHVETLRRLESQVQSSGGTNQQLISQFRAQENQVRTTAQQLIETERAFGRASSGLAGFGQSALQTGRIVQDFAQGGIGGILNNIEGLVQALGGPAGLAGVLTIVGVALSVFRPQIEQFFRTLGGGELEEFSGSLEELQRRIEELEADPSKVALDLEDLERAKRQLAELQADLARFEAAKRTATQEDIGQRATRAVRETVGSEALTGAFGLNRPVTDFLSGDQQVEFNRLEAERRRLDELLRTQDPASIYAGLVRQGIQDVNRQVQQLTADAQRVQQEQVRTRVGQFLGGDIGAIRELQNIARRNAEAFGGDAASSRLFAQQLLQLPSTGEEVQVQAQARRSIEANRRTRELAEQRARQQERDYQESVRQQQTADEIENQANADRFFDARKAQEDAAKNSERDRERSAREREQAINQQVGRFGGLSGPIQQSLLRGFSPDAITAQVARQIAGAGVPQDLRPDVGRELVNRNQQQLQARFVGLAAQGLNQHQATLAIVTGLGAEVQRLQAASAGVDARQRVARGQLNQIRTRRQAFRSR